MVPAGTGSLDLNLYLSPVTNCLQVQGLAPTAATSRGSKRWASRRRRLVFHRRKNVAPSMGPRLFGRGNVGVLIRQANGGTSAAPLGWDAHLLVRLIGIVARMPSLGRARPRCRVGRAAWRSSCDARLPPSLVPRGDAAGAVVLGPLAPSGRGSTSRKPRGNTAAPAAVRRGSEVGCQSRTPAPCTAARTGGIPPAPQVRRETDHIRYRTKLLTLH